MPKLSRELRRAAAAARVALIEEEREDEIEVVETFPEDEDNDMHDVIHELKKKKADQRSENRRTKREAKSKIEKLVIEDQEGEEKPCKIVSEHFYIAGEMVKHRKTKAIGLVLQTNDQVVNRYTCGAPREMAKVVSVQVLVAGDIQTWQSQHVLPVH